jgi:hypothetical protein
MISFKCVGNKLNMKREVEKCGRTIFLTTFMGKFLNQYGCENCGATYWGVRYEGEELVLNSHFLKDSLNDSLATLRSKM